MGFCLHKIEAKKSELWLGATYAAAKAGATAEQELLLVLRLGYIYKGNTNPREKLNFPTPKDEFFKFLS